MNETTRAMKGMGEKRIYGTSEEEAEYKRNFKAIDWGDRRERVLAEIRARKGGKQ